MDGQQSSPTAQTVTNQPPQYVQNQAEQNMGVANYLSSQPFPQYQGQLIAPLNDVQNTGINFSEQAAGAYQPYIQAAGQTDAAALGANPTNAAATNATNPFNQGLALNGNTINQYMSPYIQASLQPQLQAAQQNLADQQKQTNAQATSANAFGDARQGVQNSLNNFFGNQTLAGIEGQGFNTGYGNALQTAQGEQNLGLQEQGVQQQQQGMGLQEQNFLGQMGGQLASLGAQNQQLGLTGANAVEDAGNIQQQNQQNQLNTAYEQFLNQTQYPYQMLGVQESAISNNPYSLTNNVNLPQAGTIGSGLGAFANIAGSLGGLFGGGSSGKPFG